MCTAFNGTSSKKAFDVTLMSEVVHGRVAEACRKEAGERFLVGYHILNLDRPNFRTITVHMYNPFVTDQALVAFLGQYGEVVTSARYVKDMRGFWTGRRQYQVLLKPDPEGPGGLKHPPALFSLGGDRGYLFYSRQPAFCRQCRMSGHTEAGCSRTCCHYCGQDGHEAKVCTAPKACHGCGGEGHLYRNCASRSRTFAEVVGSTGGSEKAKESGKEPGSTGSRSGRPVQKEPADGLLRSGEEFALQEKGAADRANEESEAQVPGDNEEGDFPSITPGPASSKVKKGARRGSQVFGTGRTIRCGEGREGGHSKKSKGEGKGAEEQAQEDCYESGRGGGTGQQSGVTEVEGLQETGGGNTGLGEGGGVSVDLLSVGLGLELDLPPGLLSLPSPLGEDAYELPNRPPTSPNPLPYSWADQMDSGDLYIQ